MFNNQHQNIPELFQEIMKHHERRPQGMLCDRGYLEELREWNKRNEELRQAAEKMLRWNTDKGNLAQ